MTSLNLTATNFSSQLNNIDAYRSTLDKMVRKALADNNESLLSNVTTMKGQEIEIPVEVVTSTKEDNQQQTSTTTTNVTTDTLEYTEKRSQTKDIH